MEVEGVDPHTDTLFSFIAVSIVIHTCTCTHFSELVYTFKQGYYGACCVLSLMQGIVASTEPCGKFAEIDEEPFSLKAPAGKPMYKSYASHMQVTCQS